MRIINEIKYECRQWILKKTRNRNFYPLTYKSYWHARTKKANYNNHENIYFTAEPNIGAGIGHQIANWISGYWYAKQFNLKYAHSPFPDTKWEEFLGFGEDEIKAEELVQKYDYKKIRIPLFDEYNTKEVKRIRRIINSYSGKKVLFLAEQDQFYQDQFGVISDIKRKFYGAKARKHDKLLFSEEYFNIAIHIRRGDIAVGQSGKDSNLKMRWQDSSYFEKVLYTVVSNIKPGKHIAIYLFSQGEHKDFLEFEKFENINLCLDMNVRDSFLHMVFADLLITSKSSFSYKPALLSNGIKVCPESFWHGYPNTKDWVLVNEDGQLLNKLPLLN